MKKYDIVKIVRLTDELQKLNLQLDFHGIILSAGIASCEVMFFSDFNIGQSTICTVSNNLIEKEDAYLPKNIIKELDNYLKKQSIKNKNLVLTKPKFKESDYVEVVVEKSKYSKHNIHCGSKGFVVLDEMINNEMLIDFTYVDKNGDIYGEELSINIDDLKLVKRSTSPKN